MLWWNVVGSFYNPVTYREVSFSQTREKETDLSVCNFLLSLIISANFDLGSPTSLCLPKSFLSKNLFLNPPTQTSCEEIPCLD